MPNPRGHFLAGFIATLGLLLALGLLYASYVAYVRPPEPLKDPPRKPTRLRPTGPIAAVVDSSAAAATDKLSSAADRKAILASQSPQKRNQILVIDAYLAILGRYPNAREQASWLPPDSEGGKALLDLRRSGQDDDVISRYLAGALLESTTATRFPLIARRTKTGAEGDGAVYVAAMVARAMGAANQVLDDALLVRQLERTYGLPPEGATKLTALTALLRDLTASSDVTEHFLEEGTPLEVELDAIRTVLREGRLVVLSGADSASHGRLVLAVGFDPHGNFLVRDPEQRMGERATSAMIKAFLLRPGLLGANGAPGLWIELPARRGRCRPAVKLAGLPSGLESLVLGDENGFTGVIPGAQVNLTQARIPPGEHSLKGSLSLTAEQIDRILQTAGSPAAGSGASFVRWGRYYNLDPAYALAFFRRESWYATHSRWVGRMGDKATTRNVGNIRYTGRPNPDREPQYGEYNGFRTYATWDDAIHDWFKLLAQDSNYAGLHTVERIIPIYAPKTENDTEQYVKDVISWVEQWRAENRAALAAAGAGEPRIEPAVARSTGGASDGCPTE